MLLGEPTRKLNFVIVGGSFYHHTYNMNLQVKNGQSVATLLKGCKLHREKKEVLLSEPSTGHSHNCLICAFMWLLKRGSNPQYLMGTMEQFLCLWVKNKCGSLLECGPCGSYLLCGVGWQ